VSGGRQEGLWTRQDLTFTLTLGAKKSFTEGNEGSEGKRILNRRAQS